MHNIVATKERKLENLIKETNENNLISYFGRYLFSRYRIFPFNVEEQLFEGMYNKIRWLSFMFFFSLKGFS